MLQIVPFDLLLDTKTVLVNPTFGESSLAVGGADADLIAGDLLVDFKVRTKGAMQIWRHVPELSPPPDASVWARRKARLAAPGRRKRTATRRGAWPFLLTQPGPREGNSLV
jgi:hypothetical protein